MAYRGVRSVRIAAPRGTPPELALTRLLQRAEVVRLATGAELVAQLQAGQVEALAGNRPNALLYAAQVPGSRVLADRYAVQQQRITIPPGRAAASQALASNVTRQALASGLIRSSIERHGVQGVQPATTAPSGLPRTGGPRIPLGGATGAGLVALAVGLLVAKGRRPQFDAPD